MADAYEFSTDWSSKFAPVWKQLLNRAQPRTFLEIGSWEGRTTCFLIDECAATGPVEIHCVDTWQGGVEHDPSMMGEVEQRFDSNVALATYKAHNKVSVNKHKGTSAEILPRLLSSGLGGYFDLVYVDGSHQAPDVLLDAVLGFQLLSIGGLLIFDDYLWHMEKRGQQVHYNMPKPAIDAFVNIFFQKIQIYSAPLYQLYTKKISS